MSLALLCQRPYLAHRKNRHSWLRAAQRPSLVLLASSPSLTVYPRMTHRGWVSPMTSYPLVRTSEEGLASSPEYDHGIFSTLPAGAAPHSMTGSL